MAEPRYRWVIVAAGAVMGCIALGAMFALPVLLRPLAANTGWSTTDAGLFLASEARSLTEFQLAFGLLVGIATSAIFAPLMACVTGWFETQRSLAVSLVSAGFLDVSGAYVVEKVCHCPSADRYCNIGTPRQSRTRNIGQQRSTGNGMSADWEWSRLSGKLVGPLGLD